MQLPIRLGCAVSLVRIALHPLLLCTSLALRSFVGKKWRYLPLRKLRLSFSDNAIYMPRTIANRS